MEKITQFQYDNYKAKEYFKSKNGYTESLRYRINYKNELVEEYYFNDGSIIQRDKIIGIMA